MVEIFTSTIRYPKTDQDRLDITVKSGIEAFAPTWDMVMGHKNGTISDRKYRDYYHFMMEESHRNNRHIWDKLLERKRVVLVCFCHPGDFCHRYLLRDILVKLGATNGGEI